MNSLAWPGVIHSRAMLFSRRLESASEMIRLRFSFTLFHECHKNTAATMSPRHFIISYHDARHFDIENSIPQARSAMLPRRLHGALEYFLDDYTLRFSQYMRRLSQKMQHYHDNTLPPPTVRNAISRAIIAPLRLRHSEVSRQMLMQCLFHHDASSAHVSRPRPI